MTIFTAVITFVKVDWKQNGDQLLDTEALLMLRTLVARSMLQRSNSKNGKKQYIKKLQNLLQVLGAAETSETNQKTNTQKTDFHSECL